MDENRHDHGHASDGVPKAEAKTVTDPVCGMQVNPATSKHRFEHAGMTFHFCSAGCERKFEADPVGYLGPKTPTTGKTDAIVHLPDAPGNPAAGTRELPDLRHGPGTGRSIGRGGAQP